MASQYSYSTSTVSHYDQYSACMPGWWRVPVGRSVHDNNRRHSLRGDGCMASSGLPIMTPQQHKISFSVVHSRNVLSSVIRDTHGAKCVTTEVLNAL